MFLLVPVTETGILFTTIGYIILGEHFSYTTLISVLIVFLGAIISGLDSLPFKKPLQVIKNFLLCSFYRWSVRIIVKQEHSLLPLYAPTPLLSPEKSWYGSLPL